jgi:hypothetical protein
MKVNVSTLDRQRCCRQQYEVKRLTWREHVENNYAGSGPRHTFCSRENQSPDTGSHPWLSGSLVSVLAVKLSDRQSQDKVVMILSMYEFWERVFVHYRSSCSRLVAFLRNGTQQLQNFGLILSRNCTCQKWHIEGVYNERTYLLYPDPSRRPTRISKTNSGEVEGLTIGRWNASPSALSRLSASDSSDAP